MSGTGIGRRDFLRAGAISAAALGLGAWGAPARALGANERLRLGFIGVGGDACGRGTTLLRDVLRRSREKGLAGRVEAVVVCDIYDRHLHKARELSGAETVKDYRKVLERKDLDAVVIATPDHWHARMTLEAAEAGKDVYCEKPMTRTVAEAKTVVEAIRRTARVMQVGAGSASNDLYWQARDLIASGAIGKVLWTISSSCRNSRDGEWNYPIHPEASARNLDWDAFLGDRPKIPFSPERYFRWRKYWDYSGGIATDLFYHNLAHLQVALGTEFPRRVSAGGGAFVFHDREVPDTFQVLIDYPGDHTVVLVSSMGNAVLEEETIRGHQGTIRFEKEALVLSAEMEYRKEFRARRGLDEVRIRPRPRADHMGNFLECVRSRGKPHCDAELAYRVMVAIGMAVDAYRSGKTLYFDPVKEEVVDAPPAAPFRSPSGGGTG